MDDRILILAPRGRDAAVIAETLSGAGHKSLVCKDLSLLTAALHESAGAAILTEEALADGADTLAAWVAAQGSWSDFPFIVLVTRQPGRRPQRASTRLQTIGNIVLLERPINAETLVSAAQSAVRARRRQYETRNNLSARAKIEEQLRFALEAGRLGAWELALDDERLMTSETAKAHFGRKPDDVLTYADVRAAIHPDDVERRDAIVAESISTGRDHEVEYRVTWPDGSLHWLQVRGRPNRSRKGGPPRMSGVTLDITERKMAEEALRRLNENLEGRVAIATEQLQQSNRRLLAEIAEREQAQAALVQAQKMEAIGQLTGGIAHDFNNLLTAIVGNIDMIERRTDDERVVRMAANARQGVERATKLTAQLLAFSRTQQLDLQAIAVDGLIRGMDDLLTRTLGHTVSIETDLKAADVRATADPNQLELAILNLAINARDAMGDGGVLKIASRVADDWHEGLQPGRHVVIAVSDTGHGIPPELLQKVFDPFFTTKSVGKGTGLGLSQVYGIAIQSGGTVRIDSEVGQGTRIEIWLPVSDSAERLRPNDISASQTPLSHGERVLVIDDDPDVRRFIVQCLQSLGYRVTCADSGQVGLDRLRQDRPDLLVVDFAMPGINGAQVAAQARAISPELAVLLVTGYADAQAIEQLVNTESVLRKPFKVVDLAAAVRKALDIGLTV